MRRWIGLILCLVLSFGIWLVHNLSQSYSDIVSVPVTAESNIEGRAVRSSSEVTVSARINASGFHLLNLASEARKSKVKSVFIDSEDFVRGSGDYFTVSASSLLKYVSDIFGQGVSLESFVSGDLQFKFAPENHKKVPVKAVQSISFKPQYMSLGEMQTSPDSVVVYGDPQRLEGIESVLTRQITHNDLRGGVHGAVKLQTPAGVRLSQKEVAYSLEVTRFVEVKTTVRIGTRHVPAGSKLSVLPSTADVSFRCVFPMSINPVDRAEFYVDYNDFAKSITGRCIVHCDGLPDGVISYTVEPDVCDCTEQ